MQARTPLPDIPRHDRATAGRVPLVLQCAKVTVVHESPEELTFMISRHTSAPFTHRLCVYAAVLLAILALGLAFATAGAWPVLVCCAAQSAAVLYLWFEIEAHADDHELIRMYGDNVDVVVSRRRRISCHRFQRYWLQLVCSRDGRILGLRSHGRLVEIAVGVANQEKMQIYHLLQPLFGAGGTMPSRRAVA